MARLKFNEKDSRLRLNGHFFLLAYGRFECLRLNGWPPENVLSSALHGRGGGPQPTPELPEDLREIPKALKELTDRQQKIVYLTYVRQKPFSEILAEVQVSKSTHDIDISQAQIAVGTWLAAVASVTASKKTLD